MSKKNDAVERDICCKTAEEFLNELSPINKKWNDTPRDWIFRGIGDATWALIPSALRPTPKPVLKYAEKKNTTSPKNYAEQINLEYGLLWEFFRIADKNGLLIPEDSQIYRSPWANRNIIKKLNLAKKSEGPWPFDEIMSLAALAQHHGVPTRLMDWSNNALVSAYFAAEEGAKRLDRLNNNACYACGAKKDIKGICVSCGRDINKYNKNNLFITVWCFNWRYIIDRWPGTRSNNIEVLLVMAPRATNQYLCAQGGVFTTHLHFKRKDNKIVRDALDIVIQNTYKQLSHIPKPVMRQLKLPISKADKLLRILSEHNINAASIYPGFEGVVRHLKEWRLWDKVPTAGDLPIA